MTALLTADRCPSCNLVHGTHPEWPSCPQHRHYLHQLRVTDDGFTYACPARYPRPCTHTHTRKERATMTAETTPAALAIREGQDFWDAKQLAALAQLGISGASNADLAVFMHYCQRTGLDPFSRQIYMIGRNTKDGVRQTIQVGIDGYRVIAQRAARRDGVTLNYGKTFWYKQGERDPYEMWLDDDPPAGAAVTVYKDGKPFHGQVRFKDFAARTKQGDLMGLWATMPSHMIGKCAEAQALRKAFPHDLGGIRTDEEMGHAGNRTARATMASAAVAPPAPAPQPEPIDAQTLKDAIASEFTRLGIDDEEERAVYGYQLAGKAHGTQLDQDDLDRVLTALADCETIEHIREITGQDTLEGL